VHVVTIETAHAVDIILGSTFLVYFSIVTAFRAFRRHHT